MKTKTLALAALLGLGISACEKQEENKPEAGMLIMADITSQVYDKGSFNNVYIGKGNGTEIGDSIYYNYAEIFTNNKYILDKRQPISKKDSLVDIYLINR